MKEEKKKNMNRYVYYCDEKKERTAGFFIHNFTDNDGNTRPSFNYIIIIIQKSKKIKKNKNKYIRSVASAAILVA
jgi:hypothetical protein